MAIGKKSVFAITNVIKEKISFGRNICSRLPCGYGHAIFHKYCVCAGEQFHDRYKDAQQFLYTINHQPVSCNTSFSRSERISFFVVFFSWRKILSSFRAILLLIGEPPWFSSFILSSICSGFVRFKQDNLWLPPAWPAILYHHFHKR